MLFIETGQESILSKKYRSINNLCAVIYDQFADVLTQEEFLSKISIELTIDPEKQHFVEELFNNSVHALDFLKENGLNTELANILTKHITLSILSDFVNFVYESISCAQRGKMSVAYALLRKPLTDELLILEQLLTDHAEFINRFFHLGDPKLYDPSLPSLDRKKVIENVFKKIGNKYFFNDELIYNLRYDKSTPSGLNGISNQALHIVTTYAGYRTDNQGLNFIFSVKEDYDKYWDHYYYFVPYLLIYAATIVDELVFSWMPDSDFLKSVRELQRLLGVIKWSKKIDRGFKKQYDIILSALSKHLNSNCESCGKVNSFVEADFNLFFETQIILCPYCTHNHLASPNFLMKIEEFMKSSTNKSE